MSVIIGERDRKKILFFCINCCCAHAAATFENILRINNDLTSWANRCCALFSCSHIRPFPISLFSAEKKNCNALFHWQLSGNRSFFISICHLNCNRRFECDRFFPYLQNRHSDLTCFFFTLFSVVSIELKRKKWIKWEFNLKRIY